MKNDAQESLSITEPAPEVQTLSSTPLAYNTLLQALTAGECL